MNKINIIHRDLTSNEQDQVNLGFDQLTREEGLELESSERVSFVALEANHFVGCISGLAYKNGEQYSGWFFITDLFVQKAHRSQGLGTKLLKSIEKKVISMGGKHVWLWTSGDKALRFYKRHGYRKFTEMENWYSDKSSRVGLRKNL